MATTEQRDELLGVCDDILTLEANKQEYFERPEWGEMSFRSVTPHVEAVFWMATTLKALPSNLILTIPKTM